MIEKNNNLASVLNKALLVGALLVHCTGCMPPTKPVASYLDVTPEAEDGQATQITIPQLARSTISAPKATQFQATNVILEPGDGLYHHAEGLFEFYTPQGWKLLAEDAASARFVNPDRRELIVVLVTNTGYLLDELSSERFFKGREYSNFSHYDQYHEESRSGDPVNGVTVIAKKLVVTGQRKMVASFYLQKGQSILTMDYWADEYIFEAHFQTIKNLFISIQIDESLVAEQPVYRWVDKFSGKNDLFTIDVPDSWTYENFHSDLSSVDRFVSPDRQAKIQTIVFDDGESISHSEAGVITLDVLRENYSDFTVEEDRFLPDGVERLTWIAETGGTRGVAYFVSEDTILIVLILDCSTDFVEVYKDLWDVLARSYRVT